MLTQERLKELFYCDILTGELTWRKRANAKVPALSVAGTKNNNGYIVITINGKKYHAHRLIWLYIYGDWPIEVDHINGVRDDNRLDNLRDTDRKGNMRNRAVSSLSTTGIMGVYIEKKTGNPYAQITVDGKTIHLGTFKSIEEASSAREEALREYGFHLNHGRELA